jgi:hypothetical protein
MIWKINSTVVAPCSDAAQIAHYHEPDTISGDRDIRACLAIADRIATVVVPCSDGSRLRTISSLTGSLTFESCFLFFNGLSAKIAN